MSLLFALFFLLDRLTKIYFFSSSTLNTGAAFSLFSGWNVILALVTFVVLCFVCYWYYKEPSFALGLIALGAFSNLFDRILYGGVVDFISLGFWPSFNLADCFLVLGVFLLVRKELFCSSL